MAEKLLYLTNTNSDLSEGDLFYKALRPATGSAANITISLSKNVARTGYGFSHANEIDLRAGTGTITVKVHVQTAATATCRVRANRISSTGNVLASTDWTATQSLGTTGTKTFVTDSVDWTGASASDRLRIDYEFVTGEHSASPVIQVGVENASVETPFTNELDISVEAAGGGTTTPEPGTYDYVVAGKEVQLTAIPDGLSKKFVKWVIDSVDVFENPTTVTMDDDIVAVAHFDDADQFDLVVSVEEGDGTVTPSAGTYVKYEQEIVTIVAEADTEDYNAKIIVDSATEFDNEEFFGTAEFSMPGEEATVKVYFIPPFVRAERSDGDNESWQHITDIEDPDITDPADYLDTNGFQDDVEYFYRIKRIENNMEGEWSNEASVVYEAVDVGDVTVRPPSGEIEFDGIEPTIIAQRSCSVSSPLAEIDFNALSPTIIVVVVKHATVSATTGEIDLDGHSPTVATEEFATVISTVGDIGVDAVPPNVVATQNAHIINLPPPVSEFEGLSPTVTAEELGDVEVHPDPGQTDIQGLAPDISVSETASISPDSSDAEFEGIAPSVSATKRTSVQAVCGEIYASGKLPSFQTTKNAHVDGDKGLIGVEGLAPVISSTIGAPVLTASQPDGYIYVEWEVG